MLDLEVIRARLAAQCAGLKKVRTAADFEGVLALQCCNPAEGFVGDYREFPGDNISLSSTAQPVRCEFSLWLAVRRTVGANGEGWQTALTVPEAQARAALVDYEPGIEYAPLALRDAALEKMTRYLAYWRMSFETTFYNCNSL